MDFHEFVPRRLNHLFLGNIQTRYGLYHVLCLARLPEDRSGLEPPPLHYGRMRRAREPPKVLNELFRVRRFLGDHDDTAVLRFVDHVVSLERIRHFVDQGIRHGPRKRFGNADDVRPAVAERAPQARHPTGLRQRRHDVVAACAGTARVPVGAAFACNAMGPAWRGRNMIR